MKYRILVPPRSDMPDWQTYHGPWERPDLEIVHAPDSFFQLPDPDRIRHLRGIHAALAGTEIYDETIFKGCPDLKIVARGGVGYDSVDVGAATRHGVWVTTTPGAPDHAVAEATWLLILALARKHESHIHTLRTGGFEWRLGTELFEKTLGIIGTGRIGKRVATIGQAFGMRLLGFDINEDKPFANSVGLRYVPLRQLLTDSDVVSLHTPRLPETMGLINAEKLGWMKPTAFLINTARGGIVDENALIAALREGRLAGAALDVFAQEPPPVDHPLRKLPNVVLTPHVASATAETSRRIYLQALANIVAVLDGKRPPNPVNEVKQ